MKNTYWTHNTAYHNWILKHIHGCDNVLDVGCGDGLLVEKMSGICSHVIGIEPHIPSALRAQKRLENVRNAIIETTTFEDYSAGPCTFDAIIFVASLHHMDLETCISKTIELLAPRGKLLVVGCSRSNGFVDFSIDCLRVIPAKLGSLMNGERNRGDIGVPIQQPKLSLQQIRSITDIYLPAAKIHRGLYYRYLLSWIK